MLHDAAEYLRLQELQASPAEAAAAESSWWSRLGLAFAMGAPDSAYLTPSDSTYEGERFEIEGRLIREIGAEHPAVILGHGAAQLLKGDAGVLSVFLHAPEAWRIDRVRTLYKLEDPGAAVQLVRDSDRDRGEFVQAMSGVSWTDVRAYDVALDTAAIGLEAAIDTIVRTVKVCMGGPGAGD
jgi:cytidylate kinase